MESEGLSTLVDNGTRNRDTFCTYTSSRRNIKDTKAGTCKDEADSSVCGQLNMGMAEDEVRVADYMGPCRSLDLIQLQQENIRAF